MKLAAVRVTMAAVSNSSRRTGRGEPVKQSARVVGIPNPAMASLHRYSRMLERKTARPSPILEKGVLPAPLSCISTVPLGLANSPKLNARPSPN